METTKSRCDESKCVSSFGSSICYGNNTSRFPMMCADGFLPKVIEDEPAESVGQGSFAVKGQYFTCCPPDEAATDIVATRHCSDPIRVNDSTNMETVCENEDNRKFPREAYIEWWYFDRDTGIDGWDGIIVCCDEEINDTKDDFGFLEETECVPYCDEKYKECFTSGENKPDYIKQQTRCNLPDFPFPRPIGNATYLSFGVPFQCCKTGPGLHYVEDSVFEITVLTEFGIYSVASIASALLFFGLLMPLLAQRKSENYHSATATPRSRGEEPSGGYSSYNFYLVYISLSNLVFALFKTVTNVLMLAQLPYLTGTWSSTTGISDGFETANIGFTLWIHAWASQQILKMLKSSRLDPTADMYQPSSKQVHMEAGIFYLGAVASGALVFVMWEYMNLNEIFPYIVRKVFYLGLFVPPVVISIIMWYRAWRKYMPSPRSEMSAREREIWLLANYFYRIIFFYILVGAPVLAYYIYSFGLWSELMLSDLYEWGIFICGLVPGLQAILFSLLSLTKRDVRKYIWNLVSLSFLCGNDNGRGRGGRNKEQQDESVPGHISDPDGVTSRDESIIADPESPLDDTRND